jgi:hypothetical protein
MMDFTLNDILKICDYIIGLDRAGRARLSVAVERLRDRSKLSKDVENIITTIEPLSSEKLVDTLLNLGELFSETFKSGIKDGRGVDIWFDDMGKANIEVDIVRAREKVVDPHQEYAALVGQGGSVQTGKAGKIKAIRRLTTTEI